MNAYVRMDRINLARVRSGMRPLSGWADPSDVVTEVWSLGKKPGSWCGVPLVPLGVTGWGFGAVVPQQGRCWGWTPPGRLEAAQVHGRNLIADIERRDTTPAKPEAGWVGDELDDAAALAALVGGVTSHGFVHKPLRKVLEIFGAAGGTAYPQVYDKSDNPRAFVRKCVTMYRDVGFGGRVCPLVAAVRGPDYVEQVTIECAELGVPAALYSLQRLQEMAVQCGTQAPVPAPTPSEADQWTDDYDPSTPPAPPAPPAPPPAPPRPRGGDWGPLVLVAGLAAAYYFGRKRWA